MHLFKNLQKRKFLNNKRITKIKIRIHLTFQKSNLKILLIKHQEKLQNNQKMKKFIIKVLEKI